ncbi:bifunctional folylpolyglutamate synthase/dihydrofolate synthase [Anaerococcus vaginalis]|uniref:tetrahydrofolate synthase n=2 Tax=Anaerococcus vaginalis TaxID=33037 RepID=C7HTU1_9FIRM|nr:folylpolyglutamate synthase/dihydrofolate synthase family protein [Anaerococcus vaginalis]EEU12881.1 bifunctional protein FolC [Anaerococcus vaginalis ATCC 51170]QQB62723.1 bifunctional folylpolyglutamate synthase/dihydrofolate synthase [Anaerococcus vaginalis]
MIKDKDYYLDWIYGRGNSAGKRRDLSAIKALLNELGNPQDKIKVIHIAGTNGKGSTANYIANTLAKTSKCGLFTSPYMVEINEEVQINGKAISDEDFFSYINLIRPICEKLDVRGLKNTYFEVMTALMYKYFYDKKVDVCVVETGLGGRLDSTNIVKKPLATIITTISMDHTNILGNTIEEIAWNKAGIIKENVPVFIYPQVKGAFDVILKEANEKNSKVYKFNFDEIKIKTQNDNYNEFDFRNYKNIKTSLIGKVQIYNACNAINFLDYFKEEFFLDENIIKEGIFESKNSGRMELISKSPKVLIDGSHNKESIDALIKSLKLFKYNRLIVGFSVLKDKDYDYIIENLSSVADEMVITKVDNPRAFDLGELEKIVREKFANVNAIDNIKNAYEYSKQIAKENDLVLWCGSLYLIGEIIKYEKMNKDI